MLVLACVWFVLHAVGCSPTCERRQAVDGCTLSHGSAHCQGWNLEQGIPGLPPCTTNISFVLYKSPNLTGAQTWIKLQLSAFSHLTKLQELTIQTDQDNYRFIRIAYLTDGTFPNMRSLRIKVHQHLLYGLPIGIFSNIQSLEYLDLSRAKKLGLSRVQQMIAEQSSIKVLVLKNIQEMNQRRIYTANLDLGHFICGGSVRYLDLSYNDIAYIKFRTDKCYARIKHLNLDHNIILATEPQSILPSLVIMFPSIETFNFSSAWQNDVYQEGLWNDNVITGLSLEDEKEPPLVSSLQQIPVIGGLARYDVWLKDILQNCGNLGYLDVVRCSTHALTDFCSFLSCLSPELDMELCLSKETPPQQFEYFAEKMCRYDHCFLNFPFPLPPNLKSIKVHDIGKYAKFHNIPSQNVTHLCIHSENKLQSVDVSHVNLGYLQNYPKHFSITGLHRLRYLNIQGNELELSNYKLISSDMHELTELHIGGNIIGDVLPANLIHAQTKLFLLNLSNANLHEIEANAFLNHTGLGVLDLSYNHLSSSSLSALDLSHTSLRHLNLSHNQLTHIPASFREQLDNMHQLEVYLSGNSFICSCENLAFLHWVQRSSAITFHSADDHICKDSPGDTIHDIQVESLHCNDYWLRPLIAVVATVLTILLILGGFLGYKKRWFIWNFLFRLQERLCAPSEGSSNVSYRFDAYIVYSDEDADREWVHYKLLKDLEREHGFRVCCEHRDFPLIRDHLDNIQRAIESSRKVLVVMSKNFLKSKSGQDAVSMAYSADRDKMVVVMYKDINSPAPISEILRRILETSPCIDWSTDKEGEKLFWRKLRRALYSKQECFHHPDDVTLQPFWDTNQSHCQELL